MLGSRTCLAGSSLTLLATVATAQSTAIVSTDSAGTPGNAQSYSPSMTPDGRFVVFTSRADNIVGTDHNGHSDVFLHDRQLGGTDILTIAIAGDSGDDDSFDGTVSSDGRFVAFSSFADDLIYGDTNAVVDVFVRDRLLGQTVRASLGPAGQQGDGRSEDAHISGSGQFVAFVSSSTNFGTIGSPEGLFVRDLLSNTTEVVPVMAGITPLGVAIGGISQDGRFLVYDSEGMGSSQVYVYDRQLGTTQLASVGTGIGGLAAGACPGSSISDDGRFVSFVSNAGNLVGGDTDYWDVFVRDMQAGLTERISLAPGGLQSNGDCVYVGSGTRISGDGRFVVFASCASNLVPNDSNGVPGYYGYPPQSGTDVFLRDRTLGITERVSLADSGGEAAYGSISYFPGISADGRFVSFNSDASNLVASDANGVRDVFIRDRSAALPSMYCTAKTNSLGCVPSVGWTGLPTVSGADNFYVTASNVLNQKYGMMLWAGAPGSIPFHGGTLCLAPPIVRTPVQNSAGSPTGSDCSGTYSYHFTHAYMSAQFLGAGSVVCCQFWSRDQGFPAPNNVGLTDGLQFVIGP